MLQRFVWVIVGLILGAPVAVMGAEGFSAWFVDVGQGAATLLHQPGKCAMLVDAGPIGSGTRLNRLFEREGVERLDYVIITHPHQDHYGGLKSIARKMPIREFSDNGDVNSEERGFQDYSQLQYDLPYSVIGAGDSWMCGDLAVDVLHPAAEYDSGKDYNSRSLALNVSYRGFSLLLMGDVAGPGEKQMLRESPVPLASVIQLGHHGAEDSTSFELLKRVRPTIAVISVGPNNIGAPSPGVLGRLAENKIRAFRTDIEGTVRLRVAENGNFRVTH